jgi:hypothetical protein
VNTIIRLLSGCIFSIHGVSKALSHGFFEKKAGNQSRQGTDKKHQEGVLKTRDGKSAGGGKPLAVQYGSQYNLKHSAAEKRKKIDQSGGRSGNGHRKKLFICGKANGDGGSRKYSDPETKEIKQYNGDTPENKIKYAGDQPD